jgi:hypothetical protein
MRRIAGQRGAFTPLVGGASLVLAALALGGITVGRLAAVKRDTQRAADGAALAAAQLIRDRGMPFDAAIRASAEDVGRGNSSQPIAFGWTVSQDADSVNIEVTASIDVTGPTMIMSGGQRRVTSRARAEVSQSRFDEAERRLPKLVLALDYSGSMNSPFSGGGGRAIDVLEASVQTLLDADLTIEYGAAFYSTSVFRTVGIASGAPATISSIMATYDAGGSTNTAAALNTSRNLLAAVPDTGRYVLLVSDGEPCCGGGAFAAARAAANNVWASGGTIFTLEIRRSGSSAALDQFMTDVAGTPASRGDRNYHFVATSAADLLDEFESIVASIVCSVGPLSPVPADTASLRVYLASGGGGERAVPSVPPGGDLADFRTEERFRYDAGTQTVRLTETACDAVIDDGDDIVVRFDKPTLTE